VAAVPSGPNWTPPPTIPIKVPFIEDYFKPEINKIMKSLILSQKNAKAIPVTGRESP
jgi:hypothetical protein